MQFLKYEERDPMSDVSSFLTHGIVVFDKAKVGMRIRQGNHSCSFYIGQDGCFYLHSNLFGTFAEMINTSWCLSHLSEFILKTLKAFKIERPDMQKLLDIFVVSKKADLNYIFQNTKQVVNGSYSNSVQ